MSPLTDIFGPRRALIGMIHLPALPGAPRSAGMDGAVERALADARALRDAGFDGVLVENYNDVPFYPQRVPGETIAAMAVCVREVVRAIQIPVGVNVLRNDGLAAVAVAAAAGAQFVRINVHTGVMAADQGLLSGIAHETMRLREALRAKVAVFADVWVKHATPFPGSELEQAAEDTYRRGLADALIVTGSGTGKETDLAQVEIVRRAVPEAPIVVGSGVTDKNAGEVLAVADGAIVGSSLCVDGVAGRGVDPGRATALAASLGRMSGP